MIVDEKFRSLLLPKFFQWVRPENVTHQTVGGRLAKSIDLRLSATAYSHNVGAAYPFEVIQGM